MTLEKRFQTKTPKRILALDGGGIKGAITLGFLEKVESILKKRFYKTYGDDFRLHHYFDLIGGTSTGSIIAAGLAKGMTVKELKDVYLDLGDKVFGEKRSLFGRLKAIYDEEYLEKNLKEILGDITLGGDGLKTGICVVTKRADTGSTWLLFNNPDAPYYDDNKDILLRNVIRASSAAPTYFMPTQFDVGNGEVAAFVDGGVSTANNPALQLFLMATLEKYNFNWAKGEDKLMVVSVGTGSYKVRRSVDDVLDNKLWDWATEVPQILMNDSSELNEILLQSLSYSPTSREINSEIGDLKKDLIASEPSLHYLRYNVRLEEEEFKKLELTDLIDDIESLRKMEVGSNVKKLTRVGEVASVSVEESHFPSVFDI